MPPAPVARLRRLCLALPEAHEVEAWGSPTFRVRNKLFAMYASPSDHHGAGRPAVWCKAGPGNQALMVQADPRRFFVPPYVGPSGWIGVYLDGPVDWPELTELLRDSYDLTAPKRREAQAAKRAAAPARVALGVRVKSGWAAALLLGGSRDAPRVLDVTRLELADPRTPASLQPYHAGFGTAQTDPRVVRRLVRLVERVARRSCAALLGRYRAAGYAPRLAVVIGTSDTDPERITNAHIRIHALEGRLFRRVVQEALAAEGLRCESRLERDLLAGATEALGVPPAILKRRLAALKPAEAGPWRGEQKLAALGAWTLLAAAEQKRR